MESCFPKRDTSAFEMRRDLTIDNVRSSDILTPNLTEEEERLIFKVTLVLMLQFVKGETNEYHPSRRSHSKNPRSGQVFTDKQVQGVLHGLQEAIASPENWKKHQDQNE
jgi:hypothetical protein